MLKSVSHRNLVCKAQAGQGVFFRLIDSHEHKHDLPGLLPQVTLARLGEPQRAGQGVVSDAIGADGLPWGYNYELAPEEIATEGCYHFRAIAPGADPVDCVFDVLDSLAHIGASATGM